MLARMCLSDLHLGDDRSVLSSPETSASVVRCLEFLARGRDGSPELDTLVLCGDVWEECVPSRMSDGPGMFQESVASASRLFFGDLLTRVEIRRIVWVPGNHDLSLWRLWLRLHDNNPERLSTRYEGEQLDVTSQKFEVTFKYLLGWRRDLSAFRVAYPLWLDTPWAGGFPFLAFTHGHLMDRLVRGLEPDPFYLFLRALGCRRPLVPEHPISVRAISEASDDFTLALWERYSRRDHIYSNYIMRRLNHPDSCAGQERAWNGDSVGVVSAGQRIIPVDPRVEQISPRDGLGPEVAWFLDVLVADPRIPTPVGELRTHNPGVALTRPSCLVHGHDHLGSSRVVTSSGVPFVVADAGGFTSEHDGHLPHAHVLTWRDPGQVVPEAHVLRARLEGGS